MEFEEPFSDNDRDNYLLNVYAGGITTQTLDIEYHTKVGRELERAINFGFDSTNVPPMSPAEEVFFPIRQNIWQFSAAKQYQQVRIMSSFINVAGEVTPFSDFRKVAENVFDTFNKNYLKTEFNTAVGQSQMAREWVTIQEHKEQFKFIRYMTQKDARVRDEHDVFDGITLEVDNPFWRNFMPKNGWNCRCFVVQLERARETDLSKKKIPSWGSPELPELFKMNPGIDKYIFDPKQHPYFKVARGDAGLKKNNFNLYTP